MRTLLKPFPIVLFIVSIVFFAGVTLFLKPNPGEYRASILTMGLAFTAKALCSCVFVSEQSEEQCREYASIEQVSPKLEIQRDAKTATSTFLFFKAKASYLGPEMGCVLE
jgi:hypothetical protein